MVINSQIVAVLEVEPSFGAHPNRLSHESLDVTLAYFKDKDAESEEAQEHANSSTWLEPEARYREGKRKRRSIAKSRGS